MRVDERIFRISFILRRIAVAYDGSESSKVALDIALELSRVLGSQITVLHACREGECSDEILDEARERAKSKGVEVEIKKLVYGDKSSIASELLKEINNGFYDLVIMGARGNSYSEELKIGSVAAAVVMNSTTSFFIVR